MPDKPKRPLTSYLIWMMSVRESIKRENPSFSVTDVAKRGGEIWRKMEDKSEWEEKAAIAKIEYERAVKEFEKYRERMPTRSCVPRRLATEEPKPKKRKRN